MSFILVLMGYQFLSKKEIKTYHPGRYCITKRGIFFKSDPFDDLFFKYQYFTNFYIMIWYTGPPVPLYKRWASPPCPLKLRGTGPTKKSMY